MKIRSHIYFFLQLQKTTIQIHSYPSTEQKLLTRMKIKLSQTKHWLWLNALCSYYFGHCLQCYQTIPHFSSQQDLTEYFLHTFSKVTSFPGNNSLTFLFDITAAPSKLHSNLHQIFVPS